MSPGAEAPLRLSEHRGQPLTRPLRVGIVGAGARGAAYARHVEESGAVVAAVAEPRAQVRAGFAHRHAIAAEDQHASWSELVAAPRRCDAVVISTHDADHVGAATACARAGYDILLEKPMATTEQGCRLIVEECERAGVFLGVCHVLRYAPYTAVVRQRIAEGAVGDVVSVQHLEPVGFWHFAHSYVRGSWRDSSTSAPVLLTKSSHDIDWLGYVVGRAPRRVSSFGSLSHFRPEGAPPGAGHRCVDCRAEPSCPYSAVRIYGRGLGSAARESYFTAVVAPELTPAALADALRDGPYGLCVYGGQNNVADHQVVALEYDGGVTADFTLTAFTPVEHRRTRIFGTHGQLTTDGHTVSTFDFLTGQTTEDVVATSGASAGEGHAGGDAAMIAAFVGALTAGDASRFSSNGRASLESHAVVFAAERAREDGLVVTL
jgi:predicted dehydrogenase